MYKLYRDTYWTLRLADEMFGGIGFGNDEIHEYIRDQNGRIEKIYCPICAYGLIRPHERSNTSYILKLINDKTFRLPRSTFVLSNDQAVQRLIAAGKAKVVAEPGFHEIPRVSFDDWCAELNIDSTDFIDEDIPNEEYLLWNSNDEASFYIASVASPPQSTPEGTPQN